MRRVLRACLVGVLVCGLSVDAARAGWFLRHGGRHHPPLPVPPCATAPAVVFDAPASWSGVVTTTLIVEEVPCGPPMDEVVRDTESAGSASIPAVPTFPATALPAEAPAAAPAEPPVAPQPTPAAVESAAPAAPEPSAESTPPEPTPASEPPAPAPEAPAEEPEAPEPAADPFTDAPNSEPSPATVDPLEPVPEPTLADETDAPTSEDEPAMEDEPTLDDEPPMADPEPLEENLFEKVDALDAETSGSGAAVSPAIADPFEEPASSDDAEVMEEPASEQPQDPFGDLDPQPAAESGDEMAEEPADAPAPAADDEPVAEPAEEPAMEDAVEEPPTADEPAASEEEPAAAEAPVAPAIDPEPVAAPTASEPLRRWIDATGGHSIVGTLEAVDAAGVHIRTPAGRLIVVPIERLSAHDRGYAEAAARRLPAGAAFDTAGL